MRANVTERCRAEQSIRYGVSNDISIGMTEEAAPVRNLHTGQDQPTTLGKAV